MLYFKASVVQTKNYGFETISKIIYANLFPNI